MVASKSRKPIKDASIRPIPRTIASFFGAQDARASQIIPEEKLREVADWELRAARPKESTIKEYLRRHLEPHLFIRGGTRALVYRSLVYAYRMIFLQCYAQLAALNIRLRIGDFIDTDNLMDFLARVDAFIAPTTASPSATVTVLGGKDYQIDFVVAVGAVTWVMSGAKDPRKLGRGESPPVITNRIQFSDDESNDDPDTEDTAEDTAEDAAAVAAAAASAVPTDDPYFPLHHTPDFLAKVRSACKPSTWRHCVVEILDSVHADFPFLPGHWFELGLDAKKGFVTHYGLTVLNYRQLAYNSRRRETRGTVRELTKTVGELSAEIRQQKQVSPQPVPVFASSITFADWSCPKPLGDKPVSTVAFGGDGPNSEIPPPLEPLPSSVSPKPKRNARKAKQ